MTCGPALPGGPGRRRTALALVAPSLVLAAACAGAHREAQHAPEPRRPAQPSVERLEVRHVVEPGQTLWRIARVYGIPLEELARANGIVDPATLDIGQELFVPGATERLHVPPYPAPLAGVDAPGGTPATREALFDWPVPGGRVLSSFGAPRGGRRHSGVDIGAPPGSPVRAVDAGRVVYSGSTLSGYGKTIIIDHGGDVQSLYAHGSELLVREGSWVERGQPIARIGRSGNASTDHCHFEVRQGDIAVDPLPFLNRRTESTR
jgi:murein DD-endopeptidase MepM/ murein hydrolase activator NlpD